MAMNPNAPMSLASSLQQPANIPSQTWKKSEYLFKYIYKAEGMSSGSEVNIQLPGLNGTENLKLQADFNTGSEINEKIKRENELVQLVIDVTKQMKKNDKKAAEIALPDVPGVYIYIWKYEEKKKEPSYEESKKNFFHRQEPVINFIDN